MPVNGVDTREIIQPPFTTFPYPAVAAVDARYTLQRELCQSCRVGKTIHSSIYFNLKLE